VICLLILFLCYFVGLAIVFAERDADKIEILVISLLGSIFATICLGLLIGIIKISVQP
jgi:cytochrome bd-type quinol oxidase subunit 2